MIPALPDLLYATAVVLGSYVVLGLTGFASSLLSVPLLSWRLPLTEVVPLALAMDMICSVLLGGLNLRDVQWGELRRMAPGILFGALLGLWLAARLAPRGPLLALGVYVAWVGLRSLRHPRGSALLQGGWARPAGWLYGAAAGLAALVFGSGGPLVVAWLAQRGLAPRLVRASVPVIYLLVAAGVLLLLAVAGRLSNAAVAVWLALLIPTAVVGTVAGHMLERRVPGQRLRHIICGLLVASGAAQVYRALVIMA